ncbi:hypothetical protein [Streptomyces hilarionis]|uniref:hypothetical protein n=1 Tax=Streptomyces hilarionis TaxID=2839954 RepID=UPI00211A390E|nr:hypothetical protein [Streptomyces hilarionis]MCQ9130286.1 hypothetical protein [Streptomyces hilarionis]
MSGHGQLAQTGMPAIVIGGITYPLGGWMVAAAVAVVLGAILVVRFRYRSGLTAGQAGASRTGTSKNRFLGRR